MEVFDELLVDIICANRWKADQRRIRVIEKKYSRQRYCNERTIAFSEYATVSEHTELDDRSKFVDNQAD